ncbi:MAG: hypothetical protein QM607_13190 [Microbacterium sp.]
MRELLRRVARRIAPTAYGKLELLNASEIGRADDATVAALREEVLELRQQLHELRQDNRRVTELYDLVIERLRDDAPLRSSTTL